MFKNINAPFEEAGQIVGTKHTKIYVRLKKPKKLRFPRLESQEKNVLVQEDN